MTLFRNLIEGEMEVRSTARNVAMLKSNPKFEVYGTLISSGEMAEELINHAQYDDNPLVKKLRDGESLRDIVTKAVSKYKNKFKLPWNKKEREEYNTHMNQLERILPEIDKLKAHSFISLSEAEGTILLMTAFTSALGALIGYMDSGPVELDMVKGAVGGGAFGAFAGGMYSLLEGGKKRALGKVLNGEVKYIDKMLGRGTC